MLVLHVGMSDVGIFWDVNVMALLRRSLVTGVHINSIRIMVLHWKIYVFCTAKRKDYFELLFFHPKSLL